MASLKDLRKNGKKIERENVNRSFKEGNERKKCLFVLSLCLFLHVYKNFYGLEKLDISNVRNCLFERWTH